MGSPHQHQQHQQFQVHQQLYGDQAYWQFVLHVNNDIVLIVVFGLLIIHLLASFALILHTFIRDKVSALTDAVYLYFITAKLELDFVIIIIITDQNP